MSNMILKSPCIGCKYEKLDKRWPFLIHNEENKKISRVSIARSKRKPYAESYHFVPMDGVNYKNPCFGCKKAYMYDMRVTAASAIL
jgi:hypothetical protein